MFTLRILMASTEAKGNTDVTQTIMLQTQKINITIILKVSNFMSL